MLYWYIKRLLAASAREDPEGANSDSKCSYLMPPSVVSKLRRKIPFFLDPLHSQKEIDFIHFFYKQYI